MKEGRKGRREEKKKEEGEEKKGRKDENVLVGSLKHTIIESAS